MKTLNIILSFMVVLMTNTMTFGQGPNNDCDEIVLNSVNYIEEDGEVELGFDTADYLPLDFDPYSTYVDLNAIPFIEDQVTVYYSLDYLPEGFNQFAYPTYFRNIDYIDPTDEIELDFDSAEFLPEGFDPYDKEVQSTNVSI